MGQYEEGPYDINQKLANAQRSTADDILWREKLETDKEEAYCRARYGELKEKYARYEQVDVANQDHYVSDNPLGVEPIDLIRSLGILEPFARACIIKYVSRYPKKGGLEDLKKAQVYLGWLIEEVEGE